MSHLQDSTGIFQRYKSNPILTARDWPYPVNTVFNAGATRFKDGTLLLVRVEDRRGISHLTVATSQDGKTNWQIDPQPTFMPDPENYPEEIWGIEDPRITYLDEVQQFAIVYTAYSENGPLVSLATTKDFKSFQRCGALTHPENKDAALFPKKIDDHWTLIHRPVYGGGQAHIWIASSPDLVHWGRHRILIHARQGGWWDANKIGLNCPPIETSEGWLVFYHGVRTHASGSIYRIGLALLDLENPSQVIRRSQQWVLGPQLPYERTGDVPDANFPCGAVVDDATGELHLYYGAADTCMALATAKLDDILDFLKHDSADE
ncbi:MAG: glycosidase [bacterium]